VVLTKVRKEETRRVEKGMRVRNFRRGDGVAEVAGIEGEEGVVAIGPGEATVGAPSLFFYFFIDLHTDLVNRKTSVQWAQEDIAADSAGPPAKLSK
jgi:hypothetical protein